jgi:hypothetical protein
MAIKKKPVRPNRVKLYLDVEKDLFWNPMLTMGKANISVPVLASDIPRAKKGYPWACWLAEAIMRLAETNPKAFPHPVLYAYVIKTVAFIVNKIDGQPTNAVKYAHNFGSLVDMFDKMSKADFVKFINGTDLVLKLSPGRERRIGESAIGGNTSTGRRTLTVAKGARRRAENAGLLPASRRSDEDLYV